MTFIEKQTKNDQIYYYLSHTLRLENNKFKKIRIYLGNYSKELSKDEENQLLLDNFDKMDEKIDELYPELSTDYKHQYFFEDIDIIVSNHDNLKIEMVKKRFEKIKSNYDHYLNLRNNFVILHSFNSTKVEGNTMTQQETKLLLEEGLISELRELREANEVLNISKALDFIEEYQGDLTIRFIEEVHKIVTKNTLKESRNEGVLRPLGINVYLSGSNYKIVPGGKLVKKYLKDSIKGFYKTYEKDKIGTIIRFYASFIAIHPFIDGNGRTSRILLNWLLKQEGLPYVNYIAKDHLFHIEGIDLAIRNKGFQQLSDFVVDKIINNNFTK